MNVAINAAGIGSVKGGASFYIVHITRSLVLSDASNRYIIFCTERGEQYFSDLPDNATVISIVSKKVILRLVWEQTVLPLILCKKFNIDVLFSPNYTSPVLTFGLKTVVTIHDLSFFPLSRLYPLSRRLFKPIIKMSVARSDKVIAVSTHTKKDIVKYIGNYAEKITVVYNAAAEIFTKELPEESIQKIKQIHKIDSEYILFTGFLEPRKNLDRLIEAYSRINSDVPHKLVITGGEGWWYNTTYKRIKEFNIVDSVIFTGYVSDDQLPALYAGATLFVFISLYEGFGIAALESICCGTPVLASHNSALPEVVQNAGVYVDPCNTDEITKTLHDILTEPDKLSELRKNCSRVCKQFSWGKSAQETLKVLKNSLMR